ncbi:hypothetical protein T265_09745 [Opisthorchis viverrini]|uniref:SH2 domain-containing protein n=1 Tax=Opisthorchis viverrini TaxID=6198 RepID=A0A074Z4V6_OPIVI|nr:hypothetical protein T265_09745 [Opisthorchis viverrini]KER22093.1 hypothetical protein T265_09745 [Opisthorchis viverrini]
MPSNLEENCGVEFTESEKKGKKNRYSLKKFFIPVCYVLLASPSLLTQTPIRINKTSNDAFNKMVIQQLDARHPPDRHLTFSASPELITAPLCTDPMALSETEPDAGSELIVEEYEESLTHFADMILETLKNSGQASEPSKSQDSGSDLSVSQQLRPSIPSVSPPNMAVPWLLNMLSARSRADITPPATITGLHRIQPGQHVECLNSTGIYNEPCDAKPVRADGSSDPTVIYTFSSLQNQLIDAVKDPYIEDFRNSSESREYETFKFPINRTVTLSPYDSNASEIVDKDIESTGIYWPETEAVSPPISPTTMEFVTKRPASAGDCRQSPAPGPVAHLQSRNRTTSLSDPLSISLSNDLRDRTWFGSGSSLILAGLQSPPYMGSNLGAHECSHDDPYGVVIYSNIHIPLRTPRSSLSNVVESDTRSLHIQSSDIPLGHSLSGTHLATKSAEAVARPKSTGSRSDGTIHLAGNTSPPVSQQYQQHQLSQKNPGFVDGPRGNSVIVHHPTSPFARVPRVPTGEPKSDSSVDISKLHSSPSPSESIPSLIEPISGNTEQPCVFQSTLGTIGSSSSQIVSTSGSEAPQMATDYTVGENSYPQTELSANNLTVRSRTSDAHPTYEEAWDLKMTRQLGFGISRLTPAFDKTQQCTPLSNRESKACIQPTVASSSNLIKSINPTTTSSVGRAVPFSSSLKSTSQQAVSKPRSNSGERQIAALSSVPTASEGVIGKSSLQSYENRLFVEQPKRTESALTHQTHGAGSAGTTSEYDYAYNGSWSMGVKLNLSLAMNQNNETHPGSAAHQRTLLPASGLANHLSATLSPPAVPAHQSTRTAVNSCKADTGSARAKGVTRGPASALLPQEFDSLSTDSCDDSWDKTHGRVVRELTNCRVVDPAAVLPAVGLSNRDASIIGVPISMKSVGQASTTVVLPQSICGPQLDRPRSGVLQHSPADLRTPQSWTVRAANLQSLPLEEQPWFHPSLTRSDAEELMSNEPEGSFLVRNSETCVNDYSLTIRHKTFLHMKISRNPRGQFILGEYSQPYASVPQMIYHYASTSVPVRGAEYVMLIHPVCRQITRPLPPPPQPG